jgi:NADP-dependent 3-hydroxy acid dehydrogenase YdfG
MKDQIVLITGATAGIGAATARLFGERGARLVLTGRRGERLDALREELGSDRVCCLAFDLTQPQQLEDAFQALPEEFREITVLVNNAGAAFGMEAAWEARFEQWEQMVDLNITSLLRITHKVLPGMVARNRGHIVNIGSVAGTYPYPGGNVYGATKAFVEQFSHNLRCDLHGKDIRVTNIEPGLVETEFSMVRFAGDKAKAEAVYEGVETMEASDIAEAVVWSVSVPQRMNINRIEMMATHQSAAGFRFHGTGG